MKYILVAICLWYCLPSSSFATQLDPIGVEPAKSIVFTLSQNADLWYFNNQSPSNYHTAVSVNAAGPNHGSFSWNIASNQPAAKMSNGTASITLQDNQSVDIISAAPSDDQDDVGVDFKYNGEDVGVYNLTVFAPTSVHLLDPPGIVHAGIDTALVTGYESSGLFAIYDQFGSEIPAAVPINEYFGVRTDDYTGTNWDTSQAYSTTGQRFTDKWSATKGILAINMTPSPTPPQTPLSSIKVFHSPQGYNVGSLSTGLGRQVELHTLQMYVDHGTIFPIP